MPKRHITALALVSLTTISLLATGCCSPDDNACHAFWGLEPDPRQPARYRHYLQGWVEEVTIGVFGPEELHLENFVKPEDTEHQM